jgi:hypothetical protein
MSGELLTKQATRTKSDYIHKLLLNIVTAGIEAHVILGNKFLYQPIYVETSVRNKCRCSFFCALLTLHVSAPIGGHLQVVCNIKKFEGSYRMCQRIRCFSMFNNLRAIKYKKIIFYYKNFIFYGT